MQKLDKAQFVVQGTYNQQTQSCLICLQPITFPIQCLKCKSLFCKKCADKWKKSNHKCPKKCAQGQWIFKQSKPLSILLRCPYKNEQCTNMSPEEFQTHYKKCAKSPKYLKLEGQLKKQYLCKLGHKLTFIGTNITILFSIMSVQDVNNKDYQDLYVCNVSKIDNFVYCCLCRNPPVKRSVCPQKHKFKIRQHRLYSVICDYCAENVGKSGEYCYNEIICDYAVCVKCFNQLPKQQNVVAYQIEENPYANRNKLYGMKIND